jgi:hypothetical protein
MSFQDGGIFVTGTRHSVSGYFPVVPLARAHSLATAIYHLRFGFA